MEQNINFRKFFVKPNLPAKLTPLNELSFNMWSVWDKDAIALFNRIDPAIFRRFNHNPVKLLQNVGSERLTVLSEDAGFLYEMQTVYKKFSEYTRFKGTYKDEEGNERPYGDSELIAYFSMEFGMHEALPVYSGGLGILSGDHMKTASDMGIPLIGFGLLYRYGYFIQHINMDGYQTEGYNENQWQSMPVTKVKEENGEDLLLSIDIKNEKLWFKVWKVEVGKVKIYLLDSNIPLNNDYYRQVTDYLYVADKTQRFLQEMLLAMGSICLIKHLGLQPSVFHLNEGHSAFIIIQRLINLIAEEKRSFAAAKELIRSSTVFTTHTPVPAGNEAFPMDLARNFLSDKLQSAGLNFEEIAAYATVAGDDHFSLPALAIRFSGFINGVSKIHSKVSKHMWQKIYPELYVEEIPIKAITNGVHIQSWVSNQLIRLFDRYVGADYLHMAEKESVWKNIMHIPDNEIWEAHQSRKEQMISFIRQRIKGTLYYKRGQGVIHRELEKVLNPNWLTVGFARRFAPYKRANLLLKDKARLLKLIKDEQRPIQFVFSGKAHPADENGKAILREILDFARDNGIEDRFVFIENYDINVARHLVQGVDVWLNNPVKPLEASGTSGMKAGMNGVLNLSIADGWWPECYQSDNGWLITAGEGVHDNDELRDTLEANQIYDLLEYEIRELYYDKGTGEASGVWINMMKRSIHDVGLGFNTHRMLREYIDKFYTPSARLSAELLKNDCQQLDDLVRMDEGFKKYWGKIVIVDPVFSFEGEMKSGDIFPISAKVFLGEAPAEFFQPEIFYLYDGNKYKVLPMTFAEKDEQGYAQCRGELKVHGSGEQRINIRIRPKACVERFCGLVKWSD